MCGEFAYSWSELKDGPWKTSVEVITYTLYYYSSGYLIFMHLLSVD
jgi:hypothetical protein